MWYRQGTISVTNGSPNVQGVGTQFTTQCKAGDIFTVDEQRLYEIQSITDDLNLVLVEAYAGATASAITYAIIPNFTNTTNADLAAKIAKLVNDRQTNVDQMIGWLSGTAAGGPNSDGTYPITDFYGNTFYVKSAARFQQDVDNATTEANNATSIANSASAGANDALTRAQTAIDDANAAKATSDTATANANTATTNANAATASANTATASANTATSDANAARDAANTATTNANNATSAANTAATNAQNAADATNTAIINAQNATTAAQTATTGANTARDSANTAAGSANTAASAANTAKANADTATASANTATTNANNATASANTAATNAQNAADLANAAATNAQNQSFTTLSASTSVTTPELLLSNGAKVTADASYLNLWLPTGNAGLSIALNDGSGHADLYARAGLFDSTVQLANATANNHAVALGQADGRYAALNGSSGQNFSMSDGIFYDRLYSQYATNPSLGSVGDIWAVRNGGTAGVIFLSADGNKYLFNDGSMYRLPGQDLAINGYTAWHAGNFTPANYAPLNGNSGQNFAASAFSGSSYSAQDHFYAVPTTGGVYGWDSATPFYMGLGMQATGGNQPDVKIGATISGNDRTWNATNPAFDLYLGPNKAWHAGNFNPANYVPFINNVQGSGGFHYRDVGALESTAASFTGTLVITLPVGWTDTMMKVRIEGYDYSTGQSWAVVVGGYNYSNAWMNTYAWTDNTARIGTVRLGYDGTHCCILLGGVGSTWNYPQVFVTDVYAGYSNQSGLLASPWTISFITSEASISAVTQPTLNNAMDAATLGGLAAASYATQSWVGANYAALSGATFTGAITAPRFNFSSSAAYLYADSNIALRAAVGGQNYSQDVNGALVPFNAASATATAHVVTLGQADGRYAALNGSSAQGFAMNTGTFYSQLRSQYATGTGAAGDIFAVRSGGTTGVIFLDAGASHYLYWDGTNYNMPGGGLAVSGSQVVTAASGTAPNASTLGGLALSAASAAPGANQVLRSDANGYAYLGWLNTVSGDMGGGTPSRIYCSSDQFLRYQTPTEFGAGITPYIGKVGSASSADSATNSSQLGGYSASYYQTLGRNRAVLEDQKSANVYGGASIAGTQVRTLNTIVENNISGLSLSSNQFTLPAGTYFVQASAPAYSTGRSRLSLFNVTDNATTIWGTGTYANQTQGDSFLGGMFTISASKVFEIKHFTTNAVATDGLGTGALDGGPEVYTHVEIYQI